MGPWDPNWRPDPTGGRLIAIRAAKRGAIAAGLIFGALEVVAVVVSQRVTAPAAGSVVGPFGSDLVAGVLLALFSLPALALLGAGLTSAALGSRTSALSAGLAMAVGVPVAAVTSVMIGALILIEGTAGAGHGMRAAGIVLQTGVTAAVRISPLIAMASAGWVLVVRRLGRPT
jgi:hypothetical protein